MSQNWKARAALAVGHQLRNPRGAGGRLVGAAMRLANRQPIRATIDALELRRSDHVLDIGCGEGSAIAQMGITERVVGIDQSATMIAAARRRNRISVQSGRLSLVRCDMMALPFGSGSFDKFCAINSLYFCEDIPSFLDELRRVARPGARLAIYLTAAESMRDWAFASPATHRHFTRGQLGKELKNARVDRPDRSIEEIALAGGMTGLVATIRLDPAG